MDRQTGTPWSDGVPGVSQRQIFPGKQFVSKFTVQQHGAYWLVNDSMISKESPRGFNELQVPLTYLWANNGRPVWSYLY